MTQIILAKIKKFWINFKIFLLSISPTYWIMNFPYNKYWDEYFNKLMDNHDFIYGDEFTCKLGPVQIWIKNYPYAAFTLYNFNLHCRPSRKTIIRARNKYTADILKTIR